MFSRSRALFLLILLSCGFTAVSIKLVQIQVFQREMYLRMAIEKHQRSEIVPQRRGNIYAAESVVLAQTLTVWDVRMDGEITLRPNTDLQKIADILHVPFPDLLKKYSPKNRDIELAVDQDQSVFDNLMQLKLRNIKLIPHDMRVYPNNGLACHVIGYMDVHQKGAAGIEREMDSDLTGTPGLKWVEMDVSRKTLSGYSDHQNTPPVDGHSVNLTINIAIQQVVEEELDQIVQKYQPEAAYILVMQPQTGEIIAMASRPAFDPNDRSSFQPDLLANRCITDSVEPGSIFKIVTVSAGLNEGLVKLTTPIFCENGSFFFAGRELHDDDDSYGWLNVKEVLAKSSNIGCAKIALNYLHEDRLYNYARNFGFGERTRLLTDQGESPGKLRPVNKWSGNSITHIPMGQEVAATPIQMVTAMSVIANGGRLMKPQLVRSITDDKGNVIKDFTPELVRTVIKPETAREVTEALKAVVTEGTGAIVYASINKASHIPYTFAGKTGTAQMLENGVYSHTKHVSSFLGFLPADDPQLCILVMVRAPQTKRDYGAEVSLPSFINVGCQAAEILNIPHDIPDAPAPSTPLTLSNPRQETVGGGTHETR